ncbi:protein unc-13 homolog D-like [Antedon mediterranea]|uniref:protein unc-13 homolog D-like n=1 Tax=Antedon mediterranea TaxID=105859 RepID=UPI003AF7B3B8
MEGDVSVVVGSPPTLVITDSCLDDNTPTSLNVSKPFANSQRRHSSVDLKALFGIKDTQTLTEITDCNGNGVSENDTLDFLEPAPRERRRSFSGFIQELCSPTEENKRLDTEPAKELPKDTPFLHKQYEFESIGPPDSTSFRSYRDRSQSVGELTNLGDHIGGKFKRLFSKTESELDVTSPDQNGPPGLMNRGQSCTLPAGLRRPTYEESCVDDDSSTRRWSAVQPGALTWGRRRVSQLLDFNLKSLFTQEKTTDGATENLQEQDAAENEQDKETANELTNQQSVESLASNRDVTTESANPNNVKLEQTYEAVYEDINETIEIIRKKDNEEGTPDIEDGQVSTDPEHTTPSQQLPNRLKRNRFAVRKRQKEEERKKQDEFVEFYNQVVRTLLHPLGKFNCSEISPLELISHLQKILDVDQALHSSLIKDQVNKLPEKVVLKLRVVEAKDLKPMDSNGLSDPYFIISLGSKSASKSGTLERKLNTSSSTPHLERKAFNSLETETSSLDQSKEGSVDDGSTDKKEKKKNKTMDRIKSLGKADFRAAVSSQNDEDKVEDVGSDGSESKKDENTNDTGETRKNKKPKKIGRTKSSSKTDKITTLADANGDAENSDDNSEIKKNKKQKKLMRNKSSGKGDNVGKPTSIEGDTEDQQIYRTTVAKETLHPIWNEVFQIEVTNAEDQQLQMFLWDWDEEGSLWNVTKSLDRKHKLAGVQTIFRHMKQTMEHGKSMDDFMGQLSVSLSDISASSRIDEWYKIKKHSKGCGQCHLQLQFIMKSEDEDNTVSHVVMYYKLSKAIHKYEGKLALKNGSWDGVMSEKSKLILALYAVQRGLTQLAALNIDLAALLDFYLEANTNSKDSPEEDQATRSSIVDEHAILEATLSIHAEKLAMSSLAIYGQALKSSDDDMAFHRGIQAPDPSHILESAACSYIIECLKKLDQCPAVFPPTHVEILDQLKVMCRLDSIQSILKIKFESVGAGILKQIQNRIVSVMKEHTRQWLQGVLEPVTLPEGDVQSEELCDTIQKLNEVIKQVTVICKTNDGFKKFFNMFQVDYFVVVSEEVDQSLSKVLQNVLSKTDSFLLRHKQIPEKVNDASIATLQLYMTVKLVRFLLKQNVPNSDRLDIINFHDWFQNSLIFWMMTFRNETFSRVLKALEMDKDVKLVHAVVKYSNSAVDVQSCFAKVTEEWQNINFGCIDSRLMAITKITMLVCDGAKLYADKLYIILAENGFYEGGGKVGNFDIKDKLCITLNNIEHVRAYLDNLPSLLNWERNVEALAKHHGNEEAGRRTSDALKRLTQKASEAILMRTAQVEQQIAERMCAEVKKNIKDLVNDSSKQDESLDAVLQYLDSNLQTMYNQLMPQIFPRITKALWVALLKRIVVLLKFGQEVSYYENLKSNLDQLESYFQRSAINLKSSHMHNLDYAFLSGEMQINLMPTSQLLLKFFAMIANDMVMPIEDWGHINIQVGIENTDDDKAVIHVKILNAISLPGMDADGTSDPFVLVQLCPETMFHKNKTQKTKTISSNLNPVFNEAFEFHVKKESIANMGTVVQLTIMDHDLLWYDDFIGEVFVPLDQAHYMQSGQMIDECPVKGLPIKRPLEEEMPVCYQVLRERSKWDKDARSFTTKRQLTMKMKKSRTDKPFKLTPNNSLKREDKNEVNDTKSATDMTAIPTITVVESEC